MPPMLKTDTSVCKIRFVWFSMVVIVELDRLAACASLIARLFPKQLAALPFPSLYIILTAQSFPLIDDYFAPHKR